MSSDTLKKDKAKAYCESHRDLCRAWARHHYHKHKEAIRRKQAVFRANAHGTVLRKSTVDRYNLLYNQETQRWE